MEDRRSDDDLMRGCRMDPDSFAVFYRRHVHALLGYFFRRTRDAELAADLTAETFAAALDGSHRFDERRGPAVAWLYGIAHRQLGHALKRGAVEDRARRRLGMAPLMLTDERLERIEAIASADATARQLRVALEALPSDQRAAIEARVLHERSYDEIAASSATSSSVIRQRVPAGSPQCDQDSETSRERLLGRSRIRAAICSSPPGGDSPNPRRHPPSCAGAVAAAARRSTCRGDRCRGDRSRSGCASNPRRNEAGSAATTPVTGWQPRNPQRHYNARTRDEGPAADPEAAASSADPRRGHPDRQRGRSASGALDGPVPRGSRRIGPANRRAAGHLQRQARHP